MRQLQFLLSAIVPILAFAGCATNPMEISAGAAPGGSVAGLETYSWAADAGSSIRDPKIQDPGALDKKVRATVNARLARKGYVPSPAGSGDFLVNYQVSVQDTTSRNLSAEDRMSTDSRVSGSDGYGYMASEYYGGVAGSPTTNIINRGSILVEIKDPKSGKLLWRGSAHTNVNPSAPEITRQAKVQQAIDGIMNKFPAAG